VEFREVGVFSSYMAVGIAGIEVDGARPASGREKLRRDVPCELAVSVEPMSGEVYEYSDREEESCLACFW